MSDFLPPADNKIIVPNKRDMDHCPLCRNKWKLIEEECQDGKVYLACFNGYCMISIWVRDPQLGKYFHGEPIPCACCGKEMRLFFRSDGYLKCYCPHCKATVEHVDEKKHQAMVEAEVKAGTRWVKPKEPTK